MFLIVRLRERVQFDVVHLENWCYRPGPPISGGGDPNAKLIVSQCYWMGVTINLALRAP